MLEPETTKGGMTREQVVASLDVALACLTRWGLTKEMRRWHANGETFAMQPTLAMLTDALSITPTLLYSRLRVFFNPMLKLLVESHIRFPRKLASAKRSSKEADQPKTLDALEMQAGEEEESAPTLTTAELAGSHARSKGPSSPQAKGAPGSPTNARSRRGSVFSRSQHGPPPLGERIYLTTDLLLRRYELPAPRGGRDYHVFISAHNAGGVALVGAVAKTVGVEARWTSDPEQLDACEFFLVVLSGLTWTRGAASTAFAEQLEVALANNMQLLLCHEEPGLEDDARYAVPFNSYFVCNEGATPRKLVQLGVYEKIAIPLQGGMLRPTSLALVASVLCALETTSSIRGSVRRAISWTSFTESSRRRAGHLAGQLEGAGHAIGQQAGHLAGQLEGAGRHVIRKSLSGKSLSFREWSTTTTTAVPPVEVAMRTTPKQKSALAPAEGTGMPTRAAAARKEVRIGGAEVVVDFASAVVGDGGGTPAHTPAASQCHAIAASVQCQAVHRHTDVDPSARHSMQEWLSKEVVRTEMAENASEVNTPPPERPKPPKLLKRSMSANFVSVVQAARLEARGEHAVGVGLALDGGDSPSPSPEPTPRLKLLQRSKTASFASAKVVGDGSVSPAPAPRRLQPPRLPQRNASAGILFHNVVRQAQFAHHFRARMLASELRIDPTVLKELGLTPPPAPVLIAATASETRNALLALPETGAAKTIQGAWKRALVAWVERAAM